MTVSLCAGTITVPNSSFELPLTDLAYPAIDEWQQVPGVSSQTTGVFSNNPSGPDHIDNCDGIQAAFLFSAPQIGFFQDYNSVDYAHAQPTHDFNAVFEVGKSYDLKVGLTGASAGLNPNNGATLQAALYYRDGGGNMVIVASTNVAYDTAQFSSTHFRDFQAHLPTVKAGDAWAGKNIGISIMSTVSAELQGGIWDVDNVRLSFNGPTLVSPGFTNGHFGFTVQSDPGTFEILASADITLPISSWTSLGNVINVSGSVSFSDPGTVLARRFYLARQVP